MQHARTQWGSLVKRECLCTQGGPWSQTESQLGNVCSRGRLLTSSFPISEKPRHWRPEAAVLPQAFSPWPQHSPQTRTLPRSAWTQGLAPWADVPKETSDPRLRSVQLPRRRNWLPARGDQQSWEGGCQVKAPLGGGRDQPLQVWHQSRVCLCLFPKLLGTSEVFALDPFPPLWSTCSHKCGREPCQCVFQSPCLLAI